MMIIVMAISLVGLVISAYGIIVERKIQQDALYKPSCDISTMVSCSRAFLSPYGKMLGISNILASTIYYLVMIVVAAMNYASLALMLSFAGLILSIGFSYILYFKVKSLCPICTSLYAVNIVLAMACFFAW
jgi:vitamin-K-epoxide reductase (warfarin-sensitive)